MTSWYRQMLDARKALNHEEALLRLMVERLQRGDSLPEGAMEAQMALVQEMTAQLRRLMERAA